MNLIYKIISKGIPIGFFPDKRDAQNALDLYVKEGFIMESKDGI